MHENTKTTESRVGSGDGYNAPPDQPELTPPPDPAAMMAAARSWIEENQTLAMLGAFALGVFVGVMMRD